MCADLTFPFYLSVFGRLSGGWQKRRDRRRPPWQLLRRRLGWKDGCCRRLCRVLLEISRLLCSVAASGVIWRLWLTFAEKKIDMERSGPALTAFRRAGWPGGSGAGGAPTAALWPIWCYTGGPPSLLRPATSRAQPVPRGQTTLCTALSGLDGPSDTLPGLVCSAAPSLAQSSPKHRHSPTASFTHRPPDVRPSCALPLVPTPSKTVDQTLPPDGVGKAGAFTVRAEPAWSPLGSGRRYMICVTLFFARCASQKTYCHARIACDST